jgi:hypothetical protein
MLPKRARFACGNMHLGTAAPACSTQLCLDAERAAYFNVATPAFLSWFAPGPARFLPATTVGLQDIRPATLLVCKSLQKRYRLALLFTRRFPDAS